VRLPAHEHIEVNNPHSPATGPIREISTLLKTASPKMQVGVRKSKPQALKMVNKTIDGTDYLFIEAGGFTYYHERQTYKQARTWRSPWFVLKKK